MKTYLVTGGAGFIGSHIAEALLQRGERVRIIDNFITGKKENLEGLLKDIELIEGDIRDVETVKNAVKGVDYILHQAAMRSVPMSVEDPWTYNEVNVTGTLNILLAARDAGVKRVICASSSSCYGNTDKLPQEETHTPVPISPYAVSKLTGEHYCRVFSCIYGLETLSLRYFNVFGPRQDPTSQYAVVIPIFIKAALEDRPLEVHGDGLQTRDFTYISNAVNANILAATTTNTLSGEVLNIACNQYHSLMDLIGILSKILGGKDPKITHTPPRKGDVRHTYANIDKAKELINYEADVLLEEGLRKTVQSFK
ncbi:MAG: SDR family oxidoreductase [Anaerolineales bacterium]